MKVAIIDYQAGNLRNVQKAVEKFGEIANIVSIGKDLIKFDAIILPGVGSYFNGMKNLVNSNFKECIREEVLDKKKPFLGICLGMQLMGTIGKEGGVSEGLDLIPFEVSSFDPSKVRLPHIGWNNVIKTRDSVILGQVPNESDFYFVHSYYASDIAEKFICGKANYGINFPAVIEYKNIFGAQFHPEKSQKYGLQIIQNFINFSKNNTCLKQE